jgi:hypothetical protein
MKNTLITILSLLAALALAELTVPPGAVITAEKTVIKPVALTQIEVSELRCILPTGTNTAETVYVVTMVLTDEQGGTRRQNMRLLETEAAALMSGSGYNLADIVESATAAIQQIINQRFTSSP